MRQFCILIFLLISNPIGLMAQQVKQIDISGTIEPVKYFVVLAARNNTLTGHAFAIWGREDPLTNSSMIDGAFGFYMKETGNGKEPIFSKVPGEIANEFYKGSLGKELVRLVVQVDKVDYERSLKLKDTWESRSDYQLIENDCISFVNEIAKSLGLKIPSRDTTDRPWGFLEKYLKENNQSDYLTGQWVSTDAGKRWKLILSRDSCVWIERSASGGELKRTVSISSTNGKFRISRENDQETLALLGFQPTLRGQILSRGPLPSYMDLVRENDSRLVGTWYGLVTTKDNNATLKELKQPGTNPGKEFEFQRE